MNKQNKGELLIIASIVLVAIIGYFLSLQQASFVGANAVFKDGFVDYTPEGDSLIVRAGVSLLHESTGCRRASVNLFINDVFVDKRSFDYVGDPRFVNANPQLFVTTFTASKSLLREGNNVIRAQFLNFGPGNCYEMRSCYPLNTGVKGHCDYLNGLLASAPYEANVGSSLFDNVAEARAYYVIEPGTVEERVVEKRVVEAQTVFVEKVRSYNGFYVVLFAVVVLLIILAAYFWLMSRY